MIRHGFTDRLLHRFALGKPGMRRWWFDLECRKNDYAFDLTRRNVFVCGAARSGSTMLLRQLQETDAFAATCYRHMPFVLAPSIWGRGRPRNRSGAQLTERRHGDRIEVGPDSAEALDGVFWNTLFPNYRGRICPRDLPPELLERYAMFVENLLRHEQRQRYLSKTNQGIDKIAAIASGFPNSIVLVPFRDPQQQAASLCRQHRNFGSLDAYETRYLFWLDHHEFGSTHRPFVESENAEIPRGDPGQVDYWLEQWYTIYAYLARLAGLHDNLIPVCYERMAESSEPWIQLSKILGVEVSGQAYVNRNDPERIASVETDDGRLERCRSLYRQLDELSERRACRSD